MGTLAQQTNDNPTKITSISSNARVDYILRFSKQAVLVVDQDEAVYAPIATQYLASLNGNRNCAFVSSSTRFNDIQIRCRIIEQLFGNTLFDPEQSLAISVINYAKPTEQAISIVIEHAHTLSLQLLHELSQLAELAKKTQLDIHIVMVGSIAAAQLAAKNKVVFKDKLSIVNAEDGQLLSLSHRYLKEQGDRTFSTTAIVLMSVIALLIIFSAATLYSLYQRDALSYSSILEKQKMSSKVSLAPEKNTVVADVTPASFEPAIQAAVTDDNVPTATPSEIAQIIAASMQESAIEESAKAIQQNESQIIASKEEQPTSALIDSSNAQPSEVSTSSLISTSGEANYYQGLTSGFIVQLGLFSSEETLKQEQAKYTTQPTHYYSKLVNEKRYFVLTSPAFDNKQLAEQFVTGLPQSLQNKNPWIKSVASVLKDLQ